MYFSRSFISILTLAIAIKALELSPGVVVDSSNPNLEDLEKIYQEYPEYSLNLTERRLIRFDASSEPVFVTELEKVSSFILLLMLLQSTFRSNSKLKASTFSTCQKFSSSLS